MKIKLPTSLWSLGRNYFYYGYGTDHQGFYSVAVVEDEQEIEIPDILEQITKCHCSTVLHGKVVEISPDIISGIDAYKTKWHNDFDRGQLFAGFNPNIDTAWVNPTHDGWKSSQASRIRCHPENYSDNTAVFYETHAVTVKNITAWNYSRSQVEVVHSYYYVTTRSTLPGNVRGHCDQYKSTVQYDIPVDAMDPSSFIEEEAPFWRTTTTYFGSRSNEVHCTPVYDLEHIPHAYYHAYGERQWLRGHGQMPDIVKLAMQDAFLNAAEQFPTMADNNLSNTKDILDIILDILSGRFPDTLPKTMGELWMWWRYSFSTTNSDMKQALDYALRKHITFLKTVHFNGQAHFSDAGYGIDDAVVRCGFDVKQQTGDLLTTLLHQAHVSGTEITAYRLWDFIPFSFVVDWFLPVGDRLALKDTIRHLEADYVISNCVWSLKYQRQWEGGRTQHYSRWYQSPPSLEGYKWHSATDSSITTDLKRSIDSIVMSSSMLL